jgi:hypothetical protein
VGAALLAAIVIVTRFNLGDETRTIEFLALAGSVMIGVVLHRVCGSRPFPPSRGRARISGDARGSTAGI